MGGAVGSAVGLSACSKQERDGPVIIKTAPERCFKKKQKLDLRDEGWDSDSAEEERDMLEHFMAEATSCRSKALREKKPAAADDDDDDEGATKSKKTHFEFDHESTFLEEDTKTRVSKHSKSKLRNSSELHREEEPLPLLRAVRDGEDEQVVELLKTRPDRVHEKDYFGQTPLFFATSTGNLELVNAILDCEAEVECANKNGYTPLMRALTHGFVAVADELLRRHADLSAKDCSGESVLQVVARSGQVESTEWLLSKEEGLEQVQLRNDDGYTPLLAAVRSGKPVVCHRLLSAKANPNIADSQGRTPLLHALASNDLDLAVRLMGSHADVNAEDEGGRSVLMSLVVNLLRYPEQKQSGICGIAAALEARACVEAEDKTGSTALVLSARHNEPTLCAVLISYSADPSAMDEKDRTPLVIARMKRFTDIVKVLTEFGETRATTTKYFDRLLVRAVYYGNSAACKALLDRGADGSQKTKEGTQLKYLATRLGHSTVLRIFKDHEKAVEPAAGAQGIEEAAKRKKALHLWITELREGAQRMSELQGHCHNHDVDAILGIVTRLSEAPPTAAGVSHSASLIESFVHDRLQIVLRQVQQDLRSIRASIRQQLIMKFGEELLKWDGGASGDEHLLQQIMAYGVNSVRGFRVSKFEASDEHTVKLEAAQDQAIDPVLRVAYEVPSLYAEEVQARKMFPVFDEKRPIGKFQCPKCMLVYGNPKAFKEHAKYCQSRVGDKEEEKFQGDRKAAAESAVHILESTAATYRSKGGSCQKLFKDVVEQRKANRKEFPEAAPVLVSCCNFLEIVESICWHREEQCMREASEKSIKWGLSPQESREDATHSSICRSCLVKPTSRTAQHKDGARPCAVLCSACSFELGMKLRAGKEAICPGCHQPMSGTGLLQ